MWFCHKGGGSSSEGRFPPSLSHIQDLRYDLVVSPPIVTHLSSPLYSLWHCFDVIASTRVPQIEVTNMISQSFNSVWLRSRAKMFLFVEFRFVRVFEKIEARPVIHFVVGYPTWRSCLTEVWCVMSDMTYEILTTFLVCCFVCIGEYRVIFSGYFIINTTLPI